MISKAVLVPKWAMLLWSRSAEMGLMLAPILLPSRRKGSLHLVGIRAPVSDAIFGHLEASWGRFGVEFWVDFGFLFRSSIGNAEFLGAFYF